MSVNMVERALIFATQAHQGQTRKDESTPYILHPAEVAGIAATMTDDEEVITACVLHDTVEDTDVTLDDVRREFSDRVAEIVAGDTEEDAGDIPREVSWYTRKEKSLKHLMNSSRDVKILWLSDKLSNMRSFYRMYRAEGDRMWRHFNQKDKNVQSWYYHTIADLLSELSNTAAYEEYVYRLGVVFGDDTEKA